MQQIIRSLKAKFNTLIRKDGKIPYVTTLIHIKTTQINKIWRKKIGDLIKKNITDHDHNNLVRQEFTTQEFNKLTAENFTARLKQAN